MDEGKAVASVDEEASDLCKEMFGRVSDYLSGELAATESEYQLLRQLNQISLAKYADMTELSGRLNEVAQRLNDKCEPLPIAALVRHLIPPPFSVASLQPYCEQIDQVEASVSALEQTAYRLDAYCKRLGEKVSPFPPLPLSSYSSPSSSPFT